MDNMNIVEIASNYFLTHPHTPTHPPTHTHTYIFATILIEIQNFSTTVAIKS